MPAAEGSSVPGRRGHAVRVSSVRRWLRLHPKMWGIAAGLLALTSIGACDESGSSQPAPGASASASALLAPVPAPTGLVAELLVPRPGQTWGALRKTAGTSLRWFPATFPMAVGMLVGLPAQVVTLISDELPLVGALASTPSRRLVSAVGIHVRSGREVVAVLTTGNSATHTAQRSERSGVTVLTAKDTARTGGPALGVLENYLLIATVASDLERLGPFVARTLPTREMPTVALRVAAPAAALEGPAAEWFEQEWKAYRKALEQKDRRNRIAHGGRAPDFGDPAVALVGMDAAAEGVTQVLRSARAAELHLDPQPDGMRALLRVTAREQGVAARVVADMAVGDLGPLFLLPKSALVAVLTRSTASGRRASAKSTAGGLQRLFGDRLGQKDREFVETTLDRLARGRGDHTAYALLRGAKGPSLVMRTTIADADAFDAGARALFRLPKLRAFAEPIRQFVGEVRVSQDRLEVNGLEGKARRARLSVKPAPMRLSRGKSNQVSLAPAPIEALWWIRGQVAYGAAAVDAAPVLVDVATIGREAGAALSADSWLAAAGARAGREVGFALMAQPLALGLVGDTQGSAPALLTIGREKHAALVRLEIHPAVLRALLQSSLGARMPNQ